jgi:putative tricarboxylic transport membrane protein
MLFIEHPGTVYEVYLLIVLAYVFVVAVQLVGIRFFVQLLRVPAHLLAVGVIVMCGYGAYSIRNSPFDVYTVAVLGLLAYGLMRARIPLTPIILGLVLGPALEREFRTALILSRGDPEVFVSSSRRHLHVGSPRLSSAGRSCGRCVRPSLPANPPPGNFGDSLSCCSQTPNPDP